MQGLDDRLERVQAKEAAATAIERFIRDYSVGPDQLNGYLESQGSALLKQQVKLHGVLLRPGVELTSLRPVLPALDEFLSRYEPEFVDLAEINMKYEGYIRKEREMVDKMNRLEEVRISENFDFQKLGALSKEAREKLARTKPRTIGQASRISGVSPADISVLLVHMGR